MTLIIGIQFIILVSAERRAQGAEEKVNFIFSIWD